MSDNPNLVSLRAALERYVDPYLGESLGSAGAVREVKARGNGYEASIGLGFPVGGYQAQLTSALQQHLCAEGIDLPLQIELHADLRAHAVQRHLQPLGGIKNIVAVASGKGGVGKSTVAVNLALAWAAQGARVGILDADIYGPSQPLMLGLEGQKPSSPDGKRLKPLISHGVAAPWSRRP
jgi:ATP-binding protein involved in chromosome partitioning